MRSVTGNSIKFGVMKIFLPSQSVAFFATIVICSFYSCSPKNGDATENATVVPITAFENVDPAVKSQLATFLTGYFVLNQALISDSLAGAKVAAGKLSETAKKFEMSKLTGEQMDFYFVQSSKLKGALQEISESDDIEKARGGLATVSEAMYGLAKAFHPNESPLYYQYCPMARNNQGANWLSATKELVNPYMGQMMPECGRTQEKLD